MSRAKGSSIHHAIMGAGKIAERVRKERDLYRAGMLALLGGDDYLTEYECGHGTPIGKPCFSDCPLNPTRAALGIHGHIEE